MKLATTGPFRIALIVGAVAWIAISLAAGKREAWDSALYFALGVPALAVAAGALAWFEPRSAWRWPLGIAIGQFVAMVVTSRGELSLLPLGVVTMLALSVPSLVVALVVSAARRRADGDATA